MSSKSEKDRAKQIQDRCQNILMQMLKDEDNKYCVDCDAKGTRIFPFLVANFSMYLLECTSNKVIYIVYQCFYTTYIEFVSIIEVLGLNY